ncbi:hydroxymethylbilane synthase [Paenibacillus apiarius]|uniref:Porphobilinogen deaminase n=1 Tax=Paenibacillus apiarius TaxID=46240 RepID=A0ABT4DZ71_9BACL|nr:hydroxymethylbilane synthase [Paenibacillus apiarius]MCY9516524.1 hydroxymethylbilane synthase [Paenibacillus apiarius]MCY9522515.1 hydroxymethylbilane synthase [Paenibacillus apiarius]MCY9554561.1 hydroxymethylbilane synthase [Paenibacillus apiarius]MCY9556677.1 hydroxymethylbilane synthase [Paenibacillus apiarius]MCY9686642.1 hydroxymethylbilane synthase [Paenibacillus apiarius]
MRTIIVGTRQSALALTQTGHVIAALEDICAKENLPLRFEIRKIVTKGDRILDVTLSKVGGKGLFVKEIEQALLDKEIDIAVHSMKDMPWEQPEGLMVGAIPKREDPRDCLIMKSGQTLDDLPPGAKVGTSSLRRSCQLQAYRPDLRIEPLRGNIDTRLKKLETEGFDAIVLAAAGLHRMGWQDRITSYLPEERSVPAVGQGALGIECRQSDEEVRALLKRYHDADTDRTVRAERAFLGRLNGGCQVPIGAYATNVGRCGAIQLTGLVGSAENGEIIKETMEGDHPEALGTAVAQRLLDRGADRMLSL